MDPFRRLVVEEDRLLALHSGLELGLEGRIGQVFGLPQIRKAIALELDLPHPCGFPADVASLVFAFAIAVLVKHRRHLGIGHERLNIQFLSACIGCVVTYRFFAVDEFILDGRAVRYPEVGVDVGITVALYPCLRQSPNRLTDRKR